MTTLPLDDPADPSVGGDLTAVGRASAAGAPVDGGVGVLDRPSPEADLPAGPSDDEGRPRFEHLLHPIEWWEGKGHRFLPGAAFPFAVFVVWRLFHMWMNARQFMPDYSGQWETALFYDGERYQRILHDGYANSHVLMPNTAFFPLLSWLAAPVFWLTKSDLWTVHLTMAVTGFGAFATVWGVTKSWLDERIARRTVLLMALFPSSLFLWAFYSEGLFIMLGAGGVWADKKGRRGLASVCFLGLAATRSIGILLPLVVVAARIIRNGPSLQEVRERWYVVLAGGLAGAILLAGFIVPALDPSLMAKTLTVAVALATLIGVALRRTRGWGAVAGTATIAAFFLAFLGTGDFKLLVPAGVVFGIWALATRRVDRWCFIYPLAGAVGFAVVLLVLWRQTGDPFAFMKVQEDWGRALSPAWNSITEGFRNLYPDESTIMIPALVARNFDLWCVPIIAFGLGYLAFSRKEKFPMEAWMIGVAFIILPLVSSVLASFNRFVMADWVIYPAYAAFLERFIWRVRLGFVVAGWSIVALAIRLSASRQFEIPPWLNAIPPALFFCGIIAGLVLATTKVYVSWRAVIYTGLAVAGLWTSWLMVGRFSVNRFVG